MLTLLMGSLLTFTGCMPKYQNIKITAVSLPNIAQLMNPQGEVQLDIEIDNPENNSWTINELEINALNTKGSLLAKVILSQPLRIEKHSKQYYKVPLTIDIDDPLGAFIAVNSVRKGKDSLNVQGFAKVKSGLFVKKINFDKQLKKELAQLFQFGK